MTIPQTNFIDRRYRIRYKTVPILIFIIFKGKRYKGYMCEVSVCGSKVMLLEEANLHKHDRVEIVFVIRKESSLNNGKLVQLQFKYGTVAHITDGKIGLVIGNR